MSKKVVVIPVFNEQETLVAVLEALRRSYDEQVLLVDDGSTDESMGRLASLPQDQLTIVQHQKNLGYGSSLRSGFEWAVANGYDQLVTMDCDWQHQPCLVPKFFRELDDADVVSGSRYFNTKEDTSSAPQDRKAINMELTDRINRDTGLGITDAFCGFKAYSKRAFSTLQLCIPGYASPLEVWAQIFHNKLSLKEIPVPLIYLDPKRSFGNGLDDPVTRRALYYEVWERELRRWQDEKDHGLCSASR